MTHDTLLAKIDSVFYEDEGGMQLDLTGFNNQYRAIRAVVELHRNVDGACWECQDSIYHEFPCPTIRAIEKELL